MTITKNLQTFIYRNVIIDVILKNNKLSFIEISSRQEFILNSIKNIVLETIDQRKFLVNDTLLLASELLIIFNENKRILFVNFKKVARIFFYEDFHKRDEEKENIQKK